MLVWLRLIMKIDFLFTILIFAACLLVKANILENFQVGETKRPIESEIVFLYC